MWNGTSWAEVAISRSADKETLSYSETNKDIAQGFVDITNQKVRILVKTNGRKDTTGTLTLKSYYVECTINKGYDTDIPLKNKVVTLSQVYDLTNDVALTANVDYWIGDDRRHVVTTGLASGLYVRVRYTTWYEVKIANDIPSPWQRTATPTTPDRRLTVVLEGLTAIE